MIHEPPAIILPAPKELILPRRFKELAKTIEGLGLVPTGMLGKGSVSISAQGQASNATGQTTYTFTAVTLGADHPDREIFISVNLGLTATRNIVSITVGGAVCSLSSQGGSAASLFRCGWVLYPTGATATVIVTLDGAGNNCQIQAYRVINRPDKTASELGFSTNSTTGAINLAFSDLAIPARGFAISSVVINNNNPITIAGAGWTLDWDMSSASFHKAFSSYSPQAVSAMPSTTWSWSGSVSARYAAWSFI